MREDDFLVWSMKFTASLVELSLAQLETIEDIVKTRIEAVEIAAEFGGLTSAIAMTDAEWAEYITTNTEHAHTTRVQKAAEAVMARTGANMMLCIMAVGDRILRETPKLR